MNDDKLIPVSLQLTRRNLALIDDECQALAQKQYGLPYSRRRFVNDLISKACPSKERKEFVAGFEEAGEPVPPIKRRGGSKPMQRAKHVGGRPRKKANGSAAAAAN